MSISNARPVVLVALGCKGLISQLVLVAYLVAVRGFHGNSPSGCFRAD